MPAAARQIVERVLGQALDRDCSRFTRAGQDGHPQPRLGIVGASNKRRERLSLGVRSETQRASSLDDDFGQAAKWPRRLLLQPYPLVNRVGHRECLRLRVVQRDPARHDAEYRPDALADGIDDCLEVELLRECLADLIDDRQFRVPLLRFSEQVGRFIEQPRVIEGNAEAGREGTEQADVGVAESSLALHVLEGVRRLPGRQ